jgi:hypothetical protein
MSSLVASFYVLLDSRDPEMHQLGLSIDIRAAHIVKKGYLVGTLAPPGV